MLSRAGPDAVVSHESAARVHRLWLPYPSDDRVHLTVPGRPVTTDPRVRRHQSPLDPSEIVVLGGVRVTGVARTAVDLARGKAFAQALVPLDSAIRRVAVGEAAHTAAARTLLAAGRGELRVAAARAELDQAARRAARWPGARIVSRCLPYADPRSESPYESWSRGVLIEAGMAPEALGLEVRGASGKVYYADLAWPSRRVLGEADGLTKYGDDARTVRERLSAERHRQRDLEDAGWIVVRWSAGERAAVLTARVGGALSGPGVRVA